MQRETFEFTTSTGRKVVINKYLTGGEKRQITGVYLDAVDGETRKDRVFKAEDLTIKLLVIELDGIKENVVERLLDLPSNEIEEITAQLTPIVEVKKNTPRS